MIIDEMELLRRLGDVEPLPRAVSERSEAALREVFARADKQSGRPGGARSPRHLRRRGLQLAAAAGVAAVAAAATAIVVVNVGPSSSSGHGGRSVAFSQGRVGVAVAHQNALLARARYVLTDAPNPGAIQEVVETAGKTYVNGPNLAVTRTVTWTELSKPYNSRTTSLPAGSFEEGQTNGQFEFYDPSTNTIYREINPSPQQQAGGDPALATALTMLAAPGVTVDRNATLNGAPAIEVTSATNSQSINRYWFSPTTYQPLQFVSEDPGVGQFTADFNVTTLTGAAASPALVSIVAQHPSATITDLPNQAFVAKQSQVQGG